MKHIVNMVGRAVPLTVFMALAMTAGITPVPAQELRFDWERTVQRLEAIEGRAVPSSYATPTAVAAGGA